MFCGLTDQVFSKRILRYNVFKRLFLNRANVFLLGMMINLTSTPLPDCGVNTNEENRSSRRDKIWTGVDPGQLLGRSF